MMAFKKILVMAALIAFLSGGAYASSRKVIVIPVEFNDCRFSMSIGNIRNLSDSAAMYFTDQYAKSNSFIFDTGPVTELQEDLAYYGKNSPSRHDECIYKAVMEACIAIDDVTDFSKYEGIVLFAAGISEAEGGGEDHIWPQQSYISEWGASLCLDGTSIDSFVITTESSGLGTLCHEYAHILGLQDLYDTDGSSSGGTSKALWGNLSLMDKGNRTGPLPVNFSAIELEQLGIGECRTLSTGEFTLEPISRKKNYFKSEADTEGDYYLFECRAEEGWDKNIGCRGLMVYHIDRSDNEAGYSYYYRKTLTAAERWTYNQVNCSPSYQCAELIPANIDASIIEETGFPQEGINSFSSSTVPSFTFHNGMASRFALTNIKLSDNGNVTFTVKEPVTIKSITSFQNAAIVSWNMPGESYDVTGIQLKWYDDDGSESGMAYTDRTGSYTIERLKPDTSYKVYVTIQTDGNSYSTWGTFSTKHYREGSLPYIDMNDSRRIPLQIINLPNTVRTVWTLNGNEIQAEDDGFYTICGSGVLRAEAEDTEGNINIIEKELSSR